MSLLDKHTLFAHQPLQTSARPIQPDDDATSRETVVLRLNACVLPLASSLLFERFLVHPQIKRIRYAEIFGVTPEDLESVPHPDSWNFVVFDQIIWLQVQS